MLAGIKEKLIDFSNSLINNLQYKSEMKKILLMCAILALIVGCASPRKYKENRFTKQFQQADSAFNEQYERRSSNYKEQFIALLEKRRKLEIEHAEYYRKARELEDSLNNNLDDIDIVFAKIQSENYSLYNELFLDGRNEVVAKFEHEKILIEITRDMKYDNAKDRIEIKKSKML